MFNDINEVVNYLESKNDRSHYDREEYDSFLRKMKFEYNIPSIHITGTNGKGSTAFYLENIYLSSNKKVGLFTSPYLYKINEMISINGVNISDDDLVKYVNDNLKMFEKYELTAFEMETYIAFSYFASNKVDLSIIEVGMGGYIDATNVFTPILSIITSVQLEHTNYLGRSISEIAESKCGVIKEKVPVLIGKLVEEAQLVVEDFSKEEKSRLYIVDDYHNEVKHDGYITFDYSPYTDLLINTDAAYQLLNASVAIEATKILAPLFLVTENDIKTGLAKTFVDIRFTKMKVRNKLIYIDAAHNPNAIDILLDSLIKDNPSSLPIHCLFAAFKDKNIEKMLASLSRDCTDITLTTFDNIRARKEEDFFLFLSEYQFKDNYLDAMNDILNLDEECIVLVCGSMAFASLVEEAIKTGEIK